MPFPGIQLINLVAALLIVGVILLGWQADSGIDPTIRAFVRVVIIVVLAIWLIYFVAGILTGLPALPHR